MIKKIEKGNDVLSYSNVGSDVMIEYHPSLADRQNLKIRRAVLKLPIQTINTSINYEVDYISIHNSIEESIVIDTFNNASVNNYVCIDISDEMQNLFNSNENLLKIKIKNAYGNISFSDALELIIDLYSKKQKLNNSNYEIDCKHGGTGRINLSTGSLQYVHNDIKSDENVLPINISHVFNSFMANKEQDNVENKQLESYKVGKGWKLNVQQFLVKEKNVENLLSDEKTNGKFTYIDTNGNHHEFFEQFYYVDQSNEKHYLTASQVHIDMNGKTTYSDTNEITYEVFTKIITDSGLELKTDIEGFADLALLNKDIEEISSLKNELTKINLTLTELNNSKLNLLSKNNLLLTSRQITEDNELAQEKNIDLQKANITYYNNISPIKNALDNAKVNHRNLTDYKSYGSDNDPNTYESNTSTTILDANSSAEELTDNIFLKYDYSVFNRINKSTIPTANVDDDLKLNKYISNNISDIVGGIEKDFYEVTNNKQDELINLNETILQNTKSYSQNQYENDINEINRSLSLINQQIELYNQFKKQKSHELEELEKRVPVHYITNNDGVILGFSKTSESNIYRLTLISDNYENAIYYDYNEDDELINIINSNNKTISFDYKNNLLICITDERNRKTKFTYENGFLIKITYPNRKFSTFEYDSNGNLIKIIEPSGYGAMLTYLNNKVVGIDEITTSSKITKSSVTSSESNSNSEIEIDYYDFRSTILTNVNTGKSITYVFDNLGNVLTTYENKFENGSVVGNVRATAYDNLNDKKSFTIQSLDFAEDFLAGVDFQDNPSSTTAENYLGDNLVVGGIALVALKNNQISDNTVYTLNSPNTANTKLEKNIPTATLNRIISSGITDFVLSGWAKADSSWVERRLTDYSDNGISSTHLDGGEVVDTILDNLDFIKANRRFELRAELTYSNNGNTRTVEQYCSFDWMNTDWQYCALPVTLSEDPNDILVGLKFLFDYSYNTNFADFFGMTLKEGIWEYSEFDDEKQKIYYQNSKSKAYVTYEYEDNKLIKATIHKDGNEYETYYHYNTNGQLVRTTAYNGIITENEYNDKGTLIKSYTYHKDEPSAKFYSQDDLLDEKGNSKVEVNEFGEKILENSFVDQTGIIKTSKHKNGSVIAYGYDPDDDTLLSCFVNVGGEINSNVYGYNLDLLTTLSHNDFEYNFEYDGFGRQTKVEVAGNTYQDTTYQDSKTATALASGEKFIQTFDDSDNITKTEYVDAQNNTKTLTENTFDVYGKLLRTKDYSNDVNGVNYDLEYDKFGNVNKKSYTQNNKNIEISTTTSVDDNKTNETIKIGTAQSSIEYDYSDELDAKLQSIKFNNIVGQTVGYDKLGRINQTKLPNILTKQYNYLQKGDHASNLIASEWFGNESVIKDSLKYCYDENGNVISIKENGFEIVRYTYDGISRLVREDNKKLNKTSLFSYDKGGNIIERIEYAYSTLPSDKLTGGITFDYDYPVSGWKDQLMKYNGESFVYDSLGNPTTYRDKTLTWKYGRQLASFDLASYNYNADGIRISKTYNNVTTHFYLDGTKILAQDNGNLLTFKYGVDGVIGFTYAGVGEYFYKKNIFGDIIGIIDNNEQEIAKYVYDAWGNHKTCVLNDGQFVDISDNLSYTNDGSNNKFIAELNPFRYRGYYYDIETALYYLNSRYYDPEIGRFINADDIAILDQSKEFINGLNLYSYCNNNPLHYTDETGEFFLTSFLIGLGIAALIGATVGAVAYTATEVISYIATGEWNWSWSMFAGSVIGGTIGGALSFALPGLGVVGSAFVTGFLSQGIGMGLQNIFEGATYSLQEILMSSLLVGGISAITAGLISKIQINGITGRGSISQVARQISTKFYNGTIKHITIKTFAKILAYESYYNAFNVLTNIVINMFKHYVRSPQWGFVKS